MLLEMDEVRSGYGKMEVLHGIDLFLDRGEIMAIIGPNGAGKSTVPNSIYGIATIYSGSILYDGRDIVGMKPHQIARLGIGYTPQVNNVFPSLSVKENLELGAYGLKDGVEERVREVLEVFPEIRDRLAEQARNLSGGERQMLAVARALIKKPRLLILDEPTAGLSPKAASLLLGKIEEVRRMGVTILLVEQNVRRALRIADRACVLVAGRVTYEGDAKALLEDPGMLERFFFGLAR